MAAAKPNKNQQNSQYSGWVKLIESINTPLGFFVLALLIVESFLATVLVGAELDTNSKMVCVWLGVALFILVVCIVGALVTWRPSHLIFDQNAHLLDKGKITYGSESQTIRPDALLSASSREER